MWNSVWLAPSALWRKSRCKNIFLYTILDHESFFFTKVEDRKLQRQFFPDRHFVSVCRALALCPSLSFSLSLCLSVSLFLSVSFFLCVSLSDFLSVCMSVSVCPSLSLSLSVSVSLCLSLPPSLSLSLSLSPSLPPSLSLSLSVFFVLINFYILFQLIVDAEYVANRPWLLCQNAWRGSQRSLLNIDLYEWGKQHTIEKCVKLRKHFFSVRQSYRSIPERAHILLVYLIFYKSKVTVAYFLIAVCAGRIFLSRASVEKAGKSSGKQAGKVFTFVVILKFRPG